MSNKHTYGVYAYIDKGTGNAIYIGSDSNIQENKRNREHFQEAKAKRMKVNAYVQSHKDEVVYTVLATFLIKEHMLKFEREAINEYSPWLNVKKKQQ